MYRSHPTLCHRATTLRPPAPCCDNPQLRPAGPRSGRSRRGGASWRTQRLAANKYAVGLEALLNHMVATFFSFASSEFKVARTLRYSLCYAFQTILYPMSYPRCSISRISQEPTIRTSKCIREVLLAPLSDAWKYHPNAAVVAHLRIPSISKFSTQLQVWLRHNAIAHNPALSPSLSIV